MNLSVADDLPDEFKHAELHPVREAFQNPVVVDEMIEWRVLKGLEDCPGADVTISLPGMTAPMIFDRSECSLLIVTLSAFRGRQRNGPIARMSTGQPWSNVEAHNHSVRGLVHAAKFNKRISAPAFSVNDLRVSGIHKALAVGLSIDDLHIRATCGGRAYFGERVVAEWSICRPPEHRLRHQQDWLAAQFAWDR